MHLQKLQSTRQGKRALIAEQIEALEEAKENNLLDVVRDLIKMIEDVALALTSIDEEIVSKIDAENIATEVTETGSYNFRLTLKLQKYKIFVSKRNLPSGRETLISHHLLQTKICFILPTERNQYSTIICIVPQIAETFASDIQWRSAIIPDVFWDSFGTTVHNNQGLSDVQKFGYLKSLLEGGAARTIDGLSLTNANYEHALDLLKERYGQKNEIISAYMQTLLQLPTPAYNIRELRQFYDKLETSLRGLESLGEVQETYGSLLIPIVLDRLPEQTRRHITRDHGTGIQLGPS